MPSDLPPDRSGVPVPPPLFYAAGLMIGLLTHWAYPVVILRGGGLLRTVGGSMIVISIVFAGFAIATMMRAGTSYHVFEPTTAIVTTGPYRVSRNPMYLSMTVLYLGIALALNALWVLALVIPVLAALHRFVIAREERYLTRKFGATYLDYRARVRRWI